MSRDPKYDLLFEPVQIGPVTAPNRFYQVPHCNVLGHARPRAEAANRAVKAEGGWGVVCSQEVEIHPSSEFSPFLEGRLWDDRDIPQHRLMTDAVHAHGALAGIELAYNGFQAPNLYSRIAPLAPMAMPVHDDIPQQARAMTRRDIADLRRWHVEAAQRARRAGYDIVYVYAGHNLSVLQHFLKPQYNQRSDEYGGSVENRVRLTREILTDVKEAVGHQCAVAFRFATDELMGADGLQAESDGRDIVALLAELPDLWDVNVSDWSNDSATARFEPVEGYQEKYTAFVKTLTSKPVVGVGRFTSADAMVSQLRRGVLDLIGAARPSIADPFLPRKIDAGRLDEIRECIGCNICVAQDNQVGAITCTQNPTQGEEWKQGWHPERIAPAASDAPVLVVGSGPAGLEAALQLANRGYPVMLAEAGARLGGRVTRESRLPGLASYARVRDYRETLLRRRANVEIYLNNPMSAADVIDVGCAHVLVATGASWRRDGVGRRHRRAIPGAGDLSLFTPDDLLNGRPIAGRVLVYDDDHYLLGACIAERCRRDGHPVRLVTPAPIVSSWTEYTLEQHRVRARLLELGVEVLTLHELTRLEPGLAFCASIYNGQQRQDLEFDSLVLVTSRTPEDSLFEELVESGHPFSTLRAIGDCRAPGTVAAAVYDGHAAARRLETTEDEYAPLFNREMPALTGWNREDEDRG